MRDAVESFEPQKEFKSCISWGYRQKCSTGTVEVTVEILGGNNGHSLAAHDVNASCSSPLILPLTSRCRLTLVFFIAGMCGCMSAIEEATCGSLVFCRSVGTFLVWMLW